MKITATIDQLSINYPLNGQKLSKCIKDIADAWEFDYILGKHDGCRPVNGYTDAICWGQNSIKLMWNSNREDMGIFLYFSAEGKRAYESQAILRQMPVNWLVLFKHVSRHNGHLTRIDIAVDILGSQYSVQHIFEDLTANVVVKNSQNRELNRIKFYGTGHSVTGITVGSRSSDAYLRIYDKKIEQDSVDAPYHSLAVTANSWTRVEAEFKGNKAKIIGKDLCNFRITGPKLINYVVTQWHFYDGSDNYSFWNILIENATNERIVLSLEPRSKNHIVSMTRYFLTGGATGVLYKIKEVFGEEELDNFFDFLKKYISLSDKPSFKIPNNAPRDIEILRNERIDGLSYIDYLNMTLEGLGES